MTPRHLILWSCIVFIQALPSVLALKCYSCQYPGDPLCTSTPSRATVTDCVGVTHCAIKIQTFIGSAALYLLNRDCDYGYTSGCTTDSAYKTCYELCDSDLCNGRTIEGPTTVSTPDPGPFVTCYSCVYSYNPAADDTCVSDPAKMPSTSRVRCYTGQNQNACGVERIAYAQTELKGEVFSFWRGCRPQQSNRCVPSSTYDTCYEFCRSDLCNSGDGKANSPTSGASTAWNSFYTLAVMVSHQFMEFVHWRVL